MAEPSTRKIQAPKKNRNIEKKALDDALIFNALFVLALSWAIADTYVDGVLSSENRPECNAGREVAGNLALLEATSFSFFVFAMLISASLKLSSIADGLMMAFSDDDSRSRGKNCRSSAGVWDRVWFDASRAASVAGVLFLTLSGIYAVQIWIGLMSCGSHDALAALSRHAGLVASGFLIGYLYYYKLVPLLVRNT